MKDAVLFGRHGAGAPGTEAAPSPVRAAESGNRHEAIPARFTPRQLEVLALLCEGLSNKLICRRLNIATGTVKVHIGYILRALGVTTRLQAVVASLAHQLPVAAAQL